MKNHLTCTTLLAVVMLFALTGCERNAGPFKEELKVLGTFTQISIVGLDTAAASKAAVAAKTELLALDNIGYTFEAEGELHQLNEAIMQGKSMQVSDTLMELINSAIQLSAASGGMFNPATGQLTAFWEFHCDKEECSESPYPDEVQKLVNERVAKILAKRPSMDDLTINGNRVSSKNRLVKLEFGDIIRGLALDKSIERLAGAGASSAMIDIGGSVRSIGTRGEHDWWVGIPGPAGRQLIGSIENIDNRAVITVRAFDHSYSMQGRVYRHVVDPRDGMPVRDVRSVTVIHDSALVASAAATALMIAGPREWKTVADSMGIHEILMITKDGTIYSSPAMEHVIHWKQGIPHQYLPPGT